MRTQSPSHNSILARQKKTLNRKSEYPVQNKGRPGRKAERDGVFHNRRVYSSYHRPKKCARCNGTNLQDKSHHVKQITDLESIPKCITTSHIGLNTTEKLLEIQGRLDPLQNNAQNIF